VTFLRGYDVIADLLRYRHRRERVDVGDDIDNNQPVGFQRQRVAQLDDLAPPAAVAAGGRAPLLSF